MFGGGSLRANKHGNDGIGNGEAAGESEEEYGENAGEFAERRDKSEVLEEEDEEGDGAEEDEEEENEEPVYVAKKKVVAPVIKRDLTPEELKEREPILSLLREAGLDELDKETIAKLPAWKDVTDLYGTEPVIIGLETCKAFQNSGDPSNHFVTTAGAFNTGTNLMAELLIRNCHMPARQRKYGWKNRGVRWQGTY
jgi:hypothetical protein